MKTRFEQPRPTLLVAAIAAASACMMSHGTARAQEAADAMAVDGQALIQPESLDVNALTDDHSTNAPTAWWTYTNVTADQVGTYLNQNGARLTEIEVYSVTSGVPRFTVRMVKNSGAYAVPGWWWYYGLTAAQVTSYVNANNGRLIEVEPYDIGGGQIRFAVVMVSNTAGAARAWSYLMGVSSAQITDHINSSGHRLIDLDSYTEGGVKKYTAAFVANTGADAKSWQWWINQTPASIASKVSSFQGRIVKLERQSNGTYNFIQVKNTGSDNSAWWYQYGFASMTDLNNYGLQVASRPIDITTYVDGNGTRRYDAVFIDNANASTRRMRDLLGKTFLDANGNPTKGIFESYLKQVNGAVKVDLNSARRAETASSLKSLHLLHSMKQVELGLDTLNSAFTYYEYDADDGSNACPDPSKETTANRRTNYNFEMGLDEMMRISDNRTTRGTVLRYGGTFTPFNTTAANSGMTGTTLRHNIGCAYWNFTTGKYDPATRRNDTTAADLAHIYEGVWNQTLLTNKNSARSEFLESANPGTGAGSALQAIINDEAAKQGKSAIAAQFGSLIKSWGKGGSYGTCLPDSNGGCGQQVIVRSGTGLIQLPIKVNGVLSYRDYVFGRLISDTPVPCWEDYDTPGTNCQADVDYTNAYSNAANELYRDEIREALKTW
ncbi:serine hydrolase [Ideonella sp. DXS29W]|uniref:Serine hydrolase n=1 Tax=Ideonella lacteola TaxID=2984193 RepID=A0ABU9C099_9BURK